MKRTLHKQQILLAFLASATCIVLLGALLPVKSNYTLKGNYSLVINGTSNLHDWSEVVETVSGNAAISMNNDKSINVDAVNIKMEVKSIKSTKGNIMDNNTYKALKVDKYPYIFFTLKQPARSVKPDAGKKVFFAKGVLTVAGVTKGINMMVTLFVLDSGSFSIEGSQTLLMSDYGIESPTALFGTLKTGDAITVKFKSTFTAATIK